MQVPTVQVAGSDYADSFYCLRHQYLAFASNLFLLEEPKEWRQGFKFVSNYSIN